MAICTRIFIAEVWLLQNHISSSNPLSYKSSYATLMIPKIEGIRDTRIAFVSLSLIVAQGGVRF